MVSVWKEAIRNAARAARKWADRVSAPVAPLKPIASRAAYEPIRKVQLTDEVSRMLFDEYAAHRNTERGNEETGGDVFHAEG